MENKAMFLLLGNASEKRNARKANEKEIANMGITEGKMSPNERRAVGMRTRREASRKSMESQTKNR
jgi:hypothetical protein